VDPIFPPPEEWALNNNKHFAPDNVLQNNKFELIFDEMQEAEKLTTLNNKIKKMNFDLTEMEEENDDD
jgi:tubulin monoglycylase TTLL3/8